VELIKHEGASSYVKVARSEDAKVVEVQLRFRVTNTGHSPAQKVSLPREECSACASFTGCDAVPRERPITIGQPDFISLGPGESVKPVLTMVLGCETSCDIEQLAREVERGIYRIEFQLAWNYTGSIDPSATYETRVHYEVVGSERHLLGSSMS
jgi:hypothetical protein